MTILNQTDAQKADTTVAVGLRVRVENPDGTIAGRITLGALLPHGDNTTLTESASGELSVVGQVPSAESSNVTLANLSFLLADGSYLTGPLLQTLLGINSQSSTTPTPTPTPSPTPTPTTTISFAGAAGTQPTGTAALTSVGSNPPTGMALDGNGNLLLPSQTYAYMLFEGLGTFGDGTFEIDAAASGPQPLDIVVFLHASANNSTNTALIFQGEYGHVGAYLLGVSSGTTFSAPATFSKIRVTVAGGNLNIAVDGTTLGTVTGGTSPVSGYLGIGSSSKTSPQVAISGVSFQ